MKGKGGAKRKCGLCLRRETIILKPKRKKAPPPGVEPGSHALQAGMLTNYTIGD